MIQFSVVIPLYNKEKEIVDTINSVLSQNYRADEIIVVDDGSTDKSVQFISENFKDKVKLISQKNSGVSSARNKGIEEAKNEYICLLDGDDLWESDFLLEIKRLIEEFPNASFYSTASKSVDETGKGIKNQVSFDELFVGLIEDFPKIFSRNYGMINSSSFCMKKSTKILYLNDETKGEDICYWLELSLIGNLAFSAKPLSVYKLDASNRSGEIYKEAIVPCPIKWFYAHKEKLKLQRNYKSIRKFIYSNIFITVYGGFALSKNSISIDAVIELMKKNNDRFYLLIYPAYWIPIWLLDGIKKLRRGLR